MADAPAGVQPVLLSTARATRADWQLAVPVVVLLLLIFVVTVPFAKQQLAYVWAFIPIYQTALAITDLLTAGLLLAQFNITRSRAMLVLGCGYLFTAFMVVPHTLSFPGLFSEAGLLASRRTEDHRLALHVLARRISARGDGLRLAETKRCQTRTRAVCDQVALQFSLGLAVVLVASLALMLLSPRRALRCCRGWCRTTDTRPRWRT